jgi:hypothetical protein
MKAFIIELGWALLEFLARAFLACVHTFERFWRWFEKQCESEARLWFILPIAIPIVWLGFQLTGVLVALFTSYGYYLAYLLVFKSLQLLISLLAALLHVLTAFLNSISHW